MEQEQEAMDVAVCEIARLPLDILIAIISLASSPRDTCRDVAVVCRAFRAAADSNVVWSRFLPRDALPRLAKHELSLVPPASKKELFLRLSAGPLLLQHKLKSMWLDKDEKGAKCYMLSARALHISSTRRNWRWEWISPPVLSRFRECAHLVCVSSLEIRGNIHSSMLSPNTMYAAYLVFKIAHLEYTRTCLNFPFQKATINVRESTLTREVCLDVNAKPGYGHPHPLHLENVVTPCARHDGWMEVELGEFYVEEGAGDAGEVCISVTETTRFSMKRGLIVHGIEIKPRKLRTM